MVDHDKSFGLAAGITAAVEGDPLAIVQLSAANHEELRDASNRARVSPEVTRVSVVRVLNGLLSEMWTPAQAQAWASFVRRGYVAGSASQPIDALNITYEKAHESEIVEVVSRLDEVGDLIDGHVSVNEIGELVDLLRCNY